jgi:hypothetical protein
MIRTVSASDCRKQQSKKNWGVANKALVGESGHQGTKVSKMPNTRRDGVKSC